jgi:hypothetical protein
MKGADAPHACLIRLCVTVLLLTISYTCVYACIYMYMYMYIYIGSIPVAARYKAWVCSRLLTGIVGSNPAYGMDVCLL